MDAAEKQKEARTELIEVRDLKIQYGTGPSFSVSDASFNANEISCIIGQNGSGKSTLLRAIAGQKQYTGSITISGRQCRNLTFRERARMVSYLPQHLRAVNIDVRTLAEHGRYPYQGAFRNLDAVDNECVDKALEITGMRELEHRNIKELSGGEMQRAYLAMVIAQNSRMILLDEPTTYMDQLYREQFYHILRTLTDESRGIVMVCHELEPAFAYSDRIFLMENGKLQDGLSPEDLCEKKDVIIRNFGVTMRRSREAGTLYPYVMSRG